MGLAGMAFLAADARTTLGGFGLRVPGIFRSGFEVQFQDPSILGDGILGLGKL
jgi:hypothetical protein